MGIGSAKVVHIGELLDKEFKERGFDASLAELDVCKEWGKIVGDFINNKTIVNCKDGILYVRCSSAVVAKQLSMNKEGLMNALNTKVKKKVVKNIIIK